MEEVSNYGIAKRKVYFWEWIAGEESWELRKPNAQIKVDTEVAEESKDKRKKADESVTCTQWQIIIF